MVSPGTLVTDRRCENPITTGLRPLHLHYHTEHKTPLSYGLLPTEHKTHHYHTYSRGLPQQNTQNTAISHRENYPTYNEIHKIIPDESPHKYYTLSNVKSWDNKTSKLKIPF